MQSTIIDIQVANTITEMVVEYEIGQMTPIELCMLVSQQICIWESKRRELEGDGFA